MAALEMMLVVFYSLVATVVSEECTSTTYTGTWIIYPETRTLDCPLGCCGLTEKYCCVSTPAIFGFAIGSFVLFFIIIVCVLCCLKKAGFRVPIIRNRVTGHTRVFMQHTNGPPPLQLVESAPPPYSSISNPTYAYGNYSSPLFDANLTTAQYPPPPAPIYESGPLAPAYGQAYPSYDMSGQSNIFRAQAFTSIFGTNTNHFTRSGIRHGAHSSGIRHGGHGRSNIFSTQAFNSIFGAKNNLFTRTGIRHGALGSGARSGLAGIRHGRRK